MRFIFYRQYDGSLEGPFISHQSPPSHAIEPCAPPLLSLISDLLGQVSADWRMLGFEEVGDARCAAKVLR